MSGFIYFLSYSSLQLIHRTPYCFFLLSFFNIYIMVIFILTLYHYTTTLSVVFVLESVYEFSDMKKSYDLLEGKRRTTRVLVFLY